MCFGILSEFPRIGRGLRAVLVGVMILAGGSTGKAEAQEPLVIHAPAVGGGGDRLARAMAIGLGTAGRPAIVLNAPNAEIVTGFRSAKPDGGRLLLALLRGSSASPSPGGATQYGGFIPLALVGFESIAYGVFAPTGTPDQAAAVLEHQVVSALNGDPARPVLESMKGRVAGAAALRQFLAADFNWPSSQTAPPAVANAGTMPSPTPAPKVSAEPPAAPGVAPQKSGHPSDVVAIAVTSHVGGPSHALTRQIAEALAKARGRRAEVDSQPLGGGIVAAESFLGASPGDSRLLMITLDSGKEGISPLARAGALDRFVPLATIGVGATRYGLFAPRGTPAAIAQALEQEVAGVMTAAGKKADMGGSAALKTALAAAKGASATGKVGPSAFLTDKAKSIPVRRAGSEYSSVCVRNLKKLDAALTRAGANEYDFDLPMMRTANAALIEMARPCAAKDAEAAAYARDWENSLAIKTKFCAQPNMASHASCVSMTAKSRRRMDALLAEVRKAQRDPNYSAELGWIKGESAANVTVGDLTNRYCMAELQQAEITAQAELDKLGNKPGSVEPAEISLWLLDKKLRMGRHMCGESPGFRDLKRDEAKYKEVLATCNKVASRPCAPRLPEVQAVVAPAPVVSPPKPLRSEKPTDCERLTGSNRMSCWKQECADAKGQVEVRNQCVHCDIPGSRWVKCLDGIGAAQ